MSKNTIIAAIVTIAILPFVYLLFTVFKSEELPKFRGREVVIIDPNNGTINVPSKEAAARGEPLTAKFTSTFVEQITEKKFAGHNGLALTLHTVSGKVQDCETETSAIPAIAPFETAQMCAPFAFEKSKEPKKTALFMAPEEKLIVFGKSGQNLVRVYHHAMVATFESGDMTQSDRKHEACVVRVMMDYIIGAKLDETKACKLTP